MNRRYDYTLPSFGLIFLIQSLVLLVGMNLVSVLLVWWSGLQPFARVHFEVNAFLVGTVAAFIMMVIAMMAKDVRKQAEQIMGPFLSECHWMTLLLLSIGVGFSEELLFRGVLEPWAARIDPIGALIAVNVLFGLLHAVSFQYAILAGTLGVAMSLLAMGPGGDNLLRPMVTHSVYDFLAFLWIARNYRLTHPVEPEATAESEDDPAFAETTAELVDTTKDVDWP
ncbi:CPBP family intramembrane glutamic endopeptidase [Planctomicrobium sp. SH527]|uniref:CPBP family intramembrane glutamic endopeptidase n=1 Tax=Planctomicrobium sp. SH527 TaxID=3448123 RepID=UPI003F5B2A41